MQVGDIVFIKGARKKSTQIIWAQTLYTLTYNISNICKKRTLLHGHFSHIAMYIGFGTFVEAYPKKENGVRLTKYTDIFDLKRTDRDWKVYRNSEYHAYEEFIQENAQKYLEKKFSIDILKDNKDTYFCSKLIYTILKELAYLDLPYFENNRVYPDHFYTMVTQNKHNYWHEVTSEYQLDVLEKNFVNKVSWKYMRKIYNEVLEKNHVTDIRFHQVTDGHISNYWYLAEKINQNEATPEEIAEFENIKDENIYYGCITTFLNLVACLGTRYE